MNLTPFLIAGAAFLVFRSDRGRTADTAFETVTTGDDLPPDVPVVASDGETLVVAGSDNAQVIFVDDTGTPHDAIVDEKGNVYVKVGQTQPGLVPGSSVAMGRSRTPYTAKSPTRRGRNMRKVPIQTSYPEVNDCARAGRTVADWRWRKEGGGTRHKDQKAPLAVSNAAAVLASTPCEVYKKVAYDEMAPDAAVSELDVYYEELDFDPTSGFFERGGDVGFETDPSYQRQGRYDS